MQRDRLAVAGTWLRTARRDLDLARSIVEREPSLSAFHAQQAAEKALKALAVALADDHPRTHTAGRIARVQAPSSPRKMPTSRSRVRIGSSPSSMRD